LVRAEGTRFRLAHAAAHEPDPASAVADEWLVVGHGRGTEEDHAPPLHGQEGHEWTQDDREAVHRPPQGHRQAHHRKRSTAKRGRKTTTRRKSAARRKTTGRRSTAKRTTRRSATRKKRR